MTRLAHKLKKRIQILKGIQTDNENGGFDLTFELLTTIWAGFEVEKGFNRYVSIIRGENTEELATHYFIVRKLAIQNIGKGFTSAFGNGFTVIENIYPLKSDYFVQTNEGSTTRGRLFQIMQIARDEENNEFVKLKVKEIEEKGTGFNA